MMMPRVFTAVLIASVVLLNGCSLPRSAPLSSEIKHAQNANIAVISLTHQAPEEITQLLQRVGMPASFKNVALAALDRLSAGDKLAVTITETPAGPSVQMLLPSPLKLENVQVATDGTIFVPFVGLIGAAGQSLEDVRHRIIRKLNGKIYQPQVDLALLEQPRQTVTIYGSIQKGGTVPLTAATRRLGDLIGAAGINVRNVENAEVSINRDDDIATIRLTDFYANPLNNVALRSGDAITISESHNFVTVVGAVNQQSRVEIIGPSFSFIDAIASARGLSSEYANPRSIYLFRRQSLGISGRDGLRIYELDFRDPAALFVASTTIMHDGDIIVASASSFAQSRQLLAFVVQSLGLSANIARSVN
jgi:polysaccharide biosynthesis/export protein